MRNKFIGAVVALFVSLLGVPASADINDAGVLSGIAEVGKTFLEDDDCDKTGNATVVGRGLYLVGTPEEQGREAQGAWHLLTQVITVQHLEGVRLEVCGWLDAVAGTGPLQWPGQADPRTKGLGAACAASRGHSGMGEIGDPEDPIAKLMHLGWVSSVGGVFLVTGQYQEYESGDREQKGKKGTVLAQLLGSGTGGDCVTAFDGAQFFSLFGTFEFVNVDIVPKPPTEQCKETDPDRDRVKEQLPGSDADWKRDCPTAKK